MHWLGTGGDASVAPPVDPAMKVFVVSGTQSN